MKAFNLASETHFRLRYRLYCSYWNRRSCRDGDCEEGNVSMLSVDLGHVNVSLSHLLDRTGRRKQPILQVCGTHSKSHEVTNYFNWALAVPPTGK